MIRSSEYFRYDGRNSDDFNILNINITSGMVEESFMASREIKTTEIRGRVEPYFQEVRLEPISFSLELGYDGTFTETDLKEIRMWLSQPYYKELIFSDELDQRYFAILNSDIKITHTTNNQGYISCEFLCNSPYKYSPVMVKEYYVTTPVINLEIFNNGDLICYPKITFKTYSSGTYTIINQTDGGTAFTFTTLADDETIQVWNKEKMISTDLADTYRYSNFNQNWLRLLMGKNVLSLNSAGYIKIEYEEMYL